MTETEQDLARQLAAHPAWRWMNGIRLLYVGPPRLGFDARRVDNGDRKEPREEWIPDLADPATHGCLIAALDPWLLDVSRRRYMSDERWTVTIFLSGRTGHLSAPTFGEALARAWLAVKGKEPKP